MVSAMGKESIQDVTASDIYRRDKAGSISSLEEVYAN